MSGDTCDFSNIETRAVFNIFTLQGNSLKEIHAILTETLGEHAPSHATVKKWAAQFKRGDIYTCDEPRPGRPKRVTTSEIIDQMHELILDDQKPDFAQISS
jgi:transposase